MQKYLILTFLAACLLIAGKGRAAGESLPPVNLFTLFEYACDQEGMFYFPTDYKNGFQPGSKLINEKKLQTALQKKDRTGIIEPSIHLAFIELDAGNHSAAARHFNTAAEVMEATGRDRDAAILKILTGFAHQQALNHETAITFFTNAVSISDKNRLADVLPYANALNAQSLLLTKDFQKAAKYFQQAYDGLGKSGNKYEQARIGLQVAEVAIRRGDYALANKFLNASMSVFESQNDKGGQAMVYRDRGIINFRQSKFEEAIVQFKKSMELSPQLSVAKLLKDTYLKIFTIYSLSGDHQKSNDINIIYVSLRDSIDNAERSRILNSQFTRRDLVEKESVSEMLRKNSDISFKDMTPQELEQNRQLIEAEIERLEKEKIIEDLNIAKKLSDQATFEREERINQLTREKEQQELALTQKELEVSRARALRTNLVIAFIFIVVIAGGLYNRYLNQKKSHAALDKAYKELSETHTKLVAAQEQLVHSQKMASLGQLTAGIAHEIQNPLNFVNNFSELSIELIKEYRENENDRDAIISDIESNLQKINSHGKRADKIVKGMLTHSRSGQAEKTPADLNKMIDELLDLSYHGNRSRDNSFTADIIKNLDPYLPKVEMVMQDISRVFINLFNNAFYAVGQRVKKGEPGYVASVGVSTSLEGNEVVIKIRDNGTGIPDEVRKKIFDPFFTTKPAGEGTGLGLSLSYDIIVKGHHGKMEVNSEAGTYTEFVIILPIKDLHVSKQPEN